jgi:hypothetical protein
MADDGGSDDGIGAPFDPSDIALSPLTDSDSGRVGKLLRRLRTVGRQFAGAGPFHRRLLADIDTRVSVTGVRGKSTAVEWLQTALTARGHRTFGKVTGVEPTSMVDGFRFPVRRSEPVRLYENERELRRFAPVDAAVVENQGIRGYTTRLVNDQFVRPHLVFLTNVREDHLDTLGSTRQHIARELARAVPTGTPVVCGEQDPSLRDKLSMELDRRDAPVRFVDVPDAHCGVPAAEVVYGVDAVLQHLGERPLSDERIDTLLDAMRPEWRHLPEGRVFDAAAANDVQSTELLRNALVDPDETIQPIVRLRSDRRGRSASFLQYLNRLYDEGTVTRVRVLGSVPRAFVRRADFEAIVHDDVDGQASDAGGEMTDPVAVLDEALADGWPVVLMGNTVPGDVRAIRSAIVDRSAETTSEVTPIAAAKSGVTRYDQRDDSSVPG